MTELGRLTLAVNADKDLRYALVLVGRAAKRISRLGCDPWTFSGQALHAILELQEMIPNELKGNPANGLGKHPSQKEPQETGS